MKFRSFLVGALALTAVVACKQDEPVETPKLELDKSAVSLTATAAQATINVTSNQDWTASADADWVSVDPASGTPSDKAVAVKITAEDNETEEARTAKITVKAGKLTKTVNLTQAGKEAVEPDPEPEPEVDTYILVGEAVGGWDVDANGIVLELKDGYYFKAEVGVEAKKGMHFTKNNKWEGNVKGLHGLIAPNEIGEVGNNDISLTTGGAYDVYLTEALDKFYFMTPGKTPEEAVEHVEIATVWGVCGAIEGNGWGASADPEMTEEGEWFVAKNITFTEVNFKVRGNNSWADDLKWGCAENNQVCELNKAIAVSTCTEFKAANEGAGDNPNVYIGGAGTYDIYFSPDKKEVWVMTPGYKPGDETPEPDPVEKTYTVAGTIADNAWSNNAEIGLMSIEDEYYVVKNVPFVWSSTLYSDNTNNLIEIKVLETGTWNAYGVAEGASTAVANAEIAVVYNGNNIFIEAPEGTYDVYFDKTNEKVWVMTPGYKPGDDVPSTDPEPSSDKVSATEVTEWGVEAMTALYTQYGSAEVTEDFVYEKLYFSVGGGKFKFGENKNAAGEKVARFQFGGKGDYESGKNIVKFFVPGPGTVKVEGISSGDAARPLMVAIDGTPTSDAGYELPDKTQTPIIVEVDCSAAADGSEIALWSGNSGLNIFSIKWIPTGVTEPVLDINIDGKQWCFTWVAMGNVPSLIDFGVTMPGYAILAVDAAVYDPSSAGTYIPYIVGTYSIAKTDGTSGVVTLSAEGQSMDIPYSNATETTVHFASAALLFEDIDCVLAESKMNVVTDPTGGDTPSGPEELTEEKVIWEGSHNVASWAGNQDLAWGGYDWTTVAAGTKLKLYVTPNNPASEWWCISLRTAADGWPNINGIPTQYNKPTYSITLDLTQAIIDELIAGNGLIMTGQETTVTKVSLLPADAEVVIWEGVMESNGYSNCQIGDVNDWINNGVAVGDKVKIYMTGGETWAMMISDGQWNKWFATGEGGVQEGLYGMGFSNYDTDLSKGYIEFEVTAEMAAKIAGYQWGNALIIQGDAIKVTKISF